MTFAMIAPFLFWLLAGTITGIVSGAMTARAINVQKVGGYFHEGHTAIKYLIGGALGVGIAYVVFGFNYYGGFVYLIPLFASWFSVEILVKNHLVKRFNEANGF